MTSAAWDEMVQRSPVLGWLRHICTRLSIRRRERLLRLAETVSLGEKRFVAVIEFEQQRFLIGVTSQSISLLQGLGDSSRMGRATEAAQQSGGCH